MDLEQMLEYFEASLADRRLSRGEGRSLKEHLTRAELSRAEVALLQSRAFGLARKHLKRIEDREIVLWLEDLLKTLYSVYLDQTPPEVCEAYFFPSTNGLKRLIEVLDGARRTLEVCVFTITNDTIAEALMRAKARGVALRIISDNEKAWDPGSDILGLAKSGVSVRMDDSPAHMHNKFAIIDGRLVITGSFNWTRSAVSQNQENLIISSDERLLKKYGREFERLWTQFQP